MRRSNNQRAQQIIPSAIILIIAVVVCWVSFTAEPAEAFLFPRLISSAMAGLALLTFFNAVKGSAPRIAGFNWQLTLNLLPGTVILLIAVFWAAVTVGFYATVLVSFFLLATFYDSSGDHSPKALLKRGGVSLGFVLILYGLFTKLLRVQIPTGWLL